MWRTAALWQMPPLFSEEELALPDEKNQEAMVQTLRTIFQDYCQANGKISRETALQIMEQTDLQKMVDQIAVNIPVFYEEKQKLLEAVDLTERFEQLSVLLENEIQVMNIKTEIQEKVKARVDKNQREYILREQLKVIREELGEDTTGAEADHFQEETDKLEASDEVKERIEKEIERFKNAGKQLRGKFRDPGLYRDASRTCPGIKNPLTTWILPMPGRSWTRIITAFEKVNGAGAGISGCPRPDEERRQPHYLSGGPAGNR